MTIEDYISIVSQLFIAVAITIALVGIVLVPALLLFCALGDELDDRRRKRDLADAYKDAMSDHNTQAYCEYGDG